MPSRNRVEVVITGENKAGPALQAVSKGLGDVGQQAERTSGLLGGLGRGFGGLVSGLGQFGLAAMGATAAFQGLGGLATSLISGNREMEETAALFQAFYKDGNKVAEVMALVRKEADQTPFEFKEVARAAAGLGPAAKQANVPMMDLLKTAEILAASNPEQGLEGAAFALREAVSGDFTSVIERFNLPRQRLKELKDQGVPAVEAVRIAMKEMGYDADLIAAKAKTLGGRWSTFSDTLEGIKNRVTAPLFDALKEGLESLQRLFDDNKATIDAWADGLARGVKGAIDWVKQAGANVQRFLEYLHPDNKRDLMAEWFGPDFGHQIDNVVRTIKGFGQTVQGIFEDLFGLENQDNIQLGLEQMFGIDSSMVDTVIGPLYTVLDTIKALPGQITAIYGDLSDIWHELMLVFREEGTGAALQYLLDLGKEWGQALISWIAPMIPPFLAQLQAWAQAAWTWVQAQAPVWLAQLQTWANALWQWIEPQIPVVLAALQNLAGQMWAWVQAQASVLLAQLGVWAEQFGAWVGPAVTSFLQTWPATLNQILDNIGAAAVPLLEQLGKWGLAFLQWLGPRIPDILLALAKLALAITIFIVETAGTIALKLAQWGLEFVKWVAPQIPGLLLELGKLLLSIGNWMLTTAAPTLGRKAVEWGKAIIDGMKAGLEGLWKMITDTVSAEIRKIKIDVGPFHLSAEGFKIDAPAMPSLGTPSSNGGLGYNGDLGGPPRGGVQQAQGFSWSGNIVINGNAKPDDVQKGVLQAARAMGVI